MFNEDVLDFIKIKEELANHCSSIIAKEMALALEPMTNREKIQEALDETAFTRGHMGCIYNYRRL